MPTARATKKWPASWIRIRKPRPRIAIKVLTRAPSTRALQAGDAARGGVRLLQLVEVARGRAVGGGERLLDDLGDPEERQPPVEEGGHGDLVRRVVRARIGAAAPAGLAREREERERLQIGRRELERQAG